MARALRLRLGGSLGQLGKVPATALSEQRQCVDNGSKESSLSRQDAWIQGGVRSLLRRSQLVPELAQGETDAMPLSGKARAKHGCSRGGRDLNVSPGSAAHECMHASLAKQKTRHLSPLARRTVVVKPCSRWHQNGSRCW